MEVGEGRVGEEKSEGKGKGGGRRTTSRFYLIVSIALENTIPSIASRLGHAYSCLSTTAELHTATLSYWASFGLLHDFSA